MTFYLLCETYTVRVMLQLTVRFVIETFVGLMTRCESVYWILLSWNAISGGSICLLCCSVTGTKLLSVLILCELIRYSCLHSEWHCYMCLKIGTCAPSKIKKKKSIKGSLYTIVFSQVHDFRLQCLGILRCDFETCASPNFVPERLERTHSFCTFMKIPLTYQSVPQR